MKKIIFLLLLSGLMYTLQAQNYPYCKAGLFSDQLYYSEISIVHELDKVYGSNLDYLGNVQPLKLDIHYPNLLIDPLPLRPMIVMIHGGGFVNGSKADMTSYCAKLARAGYVAVSIDYRLGWNQTGQGGNCMGNIPQLQYAMYRALQDAHAALRYLVSQAAMLRIDTQAIFMIGQSEGAMTALNVGFMNQQEANQLLPGASADLGSIDSASNTFFEPFAIKGIVNWCGALLDTNMIQNTDSIAVLSLHGLLDSIVPVGYGPYLNCQNANNPYPLLYGPQSIYQRMKNVGICTEANYDANGTHCFFPSLEAQNYIPAKFTCFIKNLLCGNCTTESKVGYNQKPCIEAAPLSVQGIEMATTVNFVPSPAQQHITMSFTLKANAFVEIQLLSLTGQVISTWLRESLSSGFFSKTLTLSSTLPRGLYLVKLNINQAASYHKIMIQ